MDGPLDFESEDPLFRTSPVSTKRRRKVIGLDDLLTDFYKEKSKVVERESRRAKAHKCYNSDEDEDEDTNQLQELSHRVDECHQKIEEIGSADEISSWGLHVFGDQETPPPLDFPELGNCMLYQSFMSNELNSVLEISAENGITFFEELLMNGWLLKLVIICGKVEKLITTWTVNLMLYSSKRKLSSSACEFWCGVLSNKIEVDHPSVRVDWFPTYAELKAALKIYGFLLDSPIDFSSISKNVNTDSNSQGPPQNIRNWIKFVAAACQVRSRHSLFSILEAEELLGVLVSFFLDHRLQGLSLLLNEGMESLINFFTDREWNISCEKVAKSLAYRIPKDLNCLRIVECVSGVDTRSKHLRNLLALRILSSCIDKEVTDAQEILTFLTSINVKDKSCDLFKMYVFLVLTENWLSSNPLLGDNPVILQMWGLYLRNCSCQISSKDLRSYASKVRNKASYLLQNTINC